MTYGDLLDGWFDRDGGKFVKIVTENRLNWEDGLTKGDGLSTYIHGKVSDEELIRKAYSMARNTVSTMGLPNKVTVKLHPEMSATDHERLWVSTECLDEKSMTPNQRLDVFLGLTIHECCHVLFTSKEKTQNSSALREKIIHHIWNIIEDEMIETALADHSPGYMGYISAAKEYHFDFKYLQEIEKKKQLKNIAILNGDAEEEEEQTVLDRLLDILFKLVRYPKHLNDDDFLYYGKYIIDIKDILYPYPKDTEACIEAAIKIWDMFKQFYKEPPKSVSEDRPLTIAILTDDMEGGDPGDGSGEAPDMVIDMRTKKGAKEEGEAEGSPLNGIEIEEETGTQLPGDLHKDLMNSVILEAIKEALEEGFESAKMDMSKLLKRDKELGQILDGGLEQGSDKSIYFKKIGANKDEYESSRKEIAQYVPAVRRALENHGRDLKIVHKGMRTGYLDTNKLAEAVQGVQTVYERHGTVKSDKILVGLIVDQSGSMHGTKIKSARKAAILLAEALESIPYIELMIYGHTADSIKDSSTDIDVFREPGWHKRFALGNVSANSNNRDGVAIQAVCERMRKFSDRPALVFVIADGQPNARNYEGASARAHTKKTVKDLERKNFEIIQVCIEHAYDPKTMFNHFVILKDLNRLAKDLTAVIRKAALKLAKVHIS